jgi:bifunctional DNA-binding transcriptional regulator/antitoxin component of YhaV-PrlF toxin-antitoxin module
MQYTCTLIEDGDDLILPIPDEILQTLDIKEGDMLDWVDNKDGTFTIKKQGEMNGIV